jgi:hypothetical protein
VGPVVSVTANGTYNAVTNVLEELTGTATLERAIEIGGTGDNAMFRIDALTGTATIRNNELVGVEGSLDFTVPPLNGMVGHIEGGWRIKEDGTDEYWGTGTINFTLFDDPDKGRSLSGELSATFNRDGTWRVSGDAEYHLSPIIGGDVHVEMDQNLDPVIGVGLSLTNLPLMDSREIFAKELDLLPRTDVMIFPPAALNLFFGAKAGVKLDMRALLFSAEIRADGWRPRAAAGEIGAVPQFTASMSMNWGLDFQATLAAYLGISLGATGFSVGAGLEGQLEINVPLVVNPYGMLTGGPEGFGGELGIGVTIAPTLKVRGIPFVSAVLGPLDFRHDMAVFEQDLGELFRWEWGTKYKFGDVQGEEPYDATQNTATSGREAPVAAPATEQAPSFPTRAPSAPARRPGTPDIAADPGQSQEEQSGPMGELQQHIDDITAIGEGVGAIGMLFGLISSLLTGLAVAGPAGLVIMLIIEIIFNDLTWEGLVNAVRAVGRAMVVAGRLLRPYLPDWLNGIIDFASGAKPSLMDALFGADDKVRAEVDRGTHRDLPPEGRAKFCDIMMDGSCGNADEDRILVILHYSDRKGDLRQVLSHIEGGVDRLDWKLDWSQNDELWELLEQYGYSD